MILFVKSTRSGAKGKKKTPDLKVRPWKQKGCEHYAHSPFI